jgi:hypothetical protein
MRYSEFVQLGEQEQKDVFMSLSEEEIADLWDQKPYPVQEFVAEENRRYFDNTEDLHAHLLKSYFPMTKPWMADEAVGHERAHTECALALGAVSVKYSVLDTMNVKDRTSVYAHFYGPLEIPNLAWAAISMHPYNAHQSMVDMRNIKSYGYVSRDQVTRRIIRWNEQDNGLYIPEPQKQPPIYP